MRLVFAGTPDFAVTCLDAVHAAGHDVVAVYTQPDRPAGRGRQLTPSPVAQRAQELGLRIEKPERLDTPAQATLHALAPDALVVVAYGLLLPQAVLDIPRLGCLNVHASLLPRWRGAAPIERAIEAGDAETGVCIMQMDKGLDTGAVLAHATWPIPAVATAGDARTALATLGARLLVDTLAALARGTVRPQPQAAAGACYAHKLSKDEARLDWTQPAATLVRRVRAFNPTPVAWTQLGDERLRIWTARPESLAVDAVPGTIVAADADGIAVATGRGALRVRELQRAGGRAQPAAEFTRNRSLLGRQFN
ncbi:MAG: methionyl-tRNA formyltransferase [Nevskiaceae bacterium]|nr:MAG: methionyl-tRNA formyltransferase [Nevskiaceae bacterium]TBR72571.1 MAG: methionyl-tRNA formyltransferase [Nevskiaceae bacterium]